MEIRIDFRSEIYTPDGIVWGYVGEHNATKLQVFPPPEMIQEERVSKIGLEYRVGKEYVKTLVASEKKNKAESLTFSLGKDVTISEEGAVQVVGYDDNNDFVCKSDMIEFTLKPSVSDGPIEPPISPTEPSDNESKLTMVEMTSDYGTGALHTYVPNAITIECSLLPVNARVRKVEIPDVVNETDEYLALEDMAAYDQANKLSSPYYIMYPKNLQGEFFTVAACVVFPFGPNNFYSSIELGTFVDKTIKIYYEIEE